MSGTLHEDPSTSYCCRRSKLAIKHFFFRTHIISYCQWHVAEEYTRNALLCFRRISGNASAPTALRYTYTAYLVAPCAFTLYHILSRYYSAVSRLHSVLRVPAILTENFVRFAQILPADGGLVVITPNSFPHPTFVPWILILSNFCLFTNWCTSELS